MIEFLARTTIFTREGSWCRPKEWVFEIDKNNLCGCVTFYFAWFGLYVRDLNCHGD